VNINNEQVVSAKEEANPELEQKIIKQVEVSAVAQDSSFLPVFSFFLDLFAIYHWFWKRH